MSLSRAALVIRLAAIAAAAASAMPAASIAASSEQITRTSGAFATATTLPDVQPTGVGDVGRFVSFGPYIRDIQNNLTTRPGGSATVRTYGIDRLETKVLIARVFANRTELAVTPLVGGGVSKVLYTVPGVTVVDNAVNSATLSVDGSTAEFCDYSTGETKSVNTVSGAVTLLSAGRGKYRCDRAIGRNLSSWDRRTAVVGTVAADNTVAWNVTRDGAQIMSLSSPSFPTLSGDGSTLVYGTDRNATGTGVLTLVAVNLDTGASRRFTLPSTDTDVYSLWVSPSGDRIVPFEVDGVHGQIDAATGAWSAFGGAYSEGFTGVYRYGADVYFPGIVAPSGRFAALPASHEAVLADLTGAELPGAADPLSGDVYVTSSSVYTCGTIFGFLWPANNRATVYVDVVRKPVAWAPALAKADLTVKAGTTTVKTASGLLPGTRVETSFTGNFSSYSTLVTSTDAQGRVATGSVARGLGACG